MSVVQCKLFIGLISYSLCIFLSTVSPSQSSSSGIGEWQEDIQLSNCWITSWLLEKENLHLLVLEGNLLDPKHPTVEMGDFVAQIKAMLKC